MAVTKKRSRSVGIDLGTTTSCLAIFDKSGVIVCKNSQGERITPSCVGVSNTDVLRGRTAERFGLANPKSVAYGTKRLMGLSYDDPMVAVEMKYAPFSVEPAENNMCNIVLYRPNGEKVSKPAEWFGAQILMELVKAGNNHCADDEEISAAVITVPAYFNSKQKESTIAAGQIAGLNVLRIINEPTAAAMAYGVDNLGSKDKAILVYDLGGGTFDVSVLLFDSGIIEVKGVSGDTHLGGEDFDNILCQHCIQVFENQQGVSIQNNDKAKKRLRMACQEAKKSLSSSLSYTFYIESLSEGVDFDYTITRAKFDDLCAPEFARTLTFVDRALAEAKFSKSEISDILMVGGSTRIPKIQSLIKDYFPGVNLIQSLDPDESVAIGACVQCAILQNENSNAIKDLLLLDVVPLSIGIETLGKVFTPIIKANTTIPCKGEQIFSTAMDNQDAVDIKIYEGQRSMTADNFFLGNFELKGIAPAPKGVPQIKVMFDVDANGIMHVTACDTASTKSANLTVKPDKNRLSPEQIEKLKNEAESAREEDEKRQAKVLDKLALQDLCERVRKAIQDPTSAAKVSSTQLESIKKLCGECEIFCRTSDSSPDILSVDFQSRTTELNTLAEPLLQGSGAQPGPGFDPSNFTKGSAEAGNPSQPTVEEVD